MKHIRIHLDFTDPILGTSPANKALLTEFIASKAPRDDLAEEEIATGSDGDKGLTVFPRGKSGEPIFWDYQIKGFFKDACSMLGRIKGKNKSSALKAYKKVIDGLVFVEPREIPIKTDAPISILERPLRTMTMQGERVALTSSEQIDEGASCDFTVTLLDDDLEDVLREWLDYGMMRGLGQWRNSGKGRFGWEEI